MESYFHSNMGEDDWLNEAVRRQIERIVNASDRNLMRKVPQNKALFSGHLS
jgi:hypothetical protein